MGKKKNYVVTIMFLVLFVLAIGAISAYAANAPTQLKAEYNDGALGLSVRLTWVKSFENVDASYIQRENPDGSTELFSHTGAISRYYDMDVERNKTYKYRIQERSGNLNTYWTDWVTIKIPRAMIERAPIDTLKPLDSDKITAPSDLQGVAVSSTEVKLTWKDNSNNEDAFMIRRSGPGEDEHVFMVAANITSYADTGLVPNTTYGYQMVAMRQTPDVAVSNFSNVWIVTTPGKTQTPSPTPPDDTAPGDHTTIQFYIGHTEYYVDGELLNMDTAPIIMESRTLLPIRFVAEPLGAAVYWDSGQQSVTITLGGKAIVLWIGQSQARVDGQMQPIDSLNPNVTPVIVPPGRTMLPLRFIAESLGCQVEWDAATQEATVIYPPAAIDMKLIKR